MQLKLQFYLNVTCKTNDSLNGLLWITAHLLEGMPRFFLFLLSLYSCVGYAFAHYTQVFFSLLSMSSYKSKLFVFFLSSVLC